MDMDIELLRRVAFGELTPEQAAELLTPPPKRQRGRPKKPPPTLIYLRAEDGTRTCITPTKKRRKVSPNEAVIAAFYLKQRRQGLTGLRAMDATLKRFSTKKNHLEASTIRAYVRDYRRDRKRAAMWQRMREEAFAAMREALIRSSYAGAMRIAEAQAAMLEKSHAAIREAATKPLYLVFCDG